MMMDSLEIWQKKGGKPLRERLNQKVKQILQEHEPAALPNDVKAELKGIIDQAK